MRGLLITALTYAGSCLYGPFRGFLIYGCRRGALVQTEQSGKCETQISPMTEAFLHHLPDQEPYHYSIKHTLKPAMML